MVCWAQGPAATHYRKVCASAALRLPPLLVAMLLLPKLLKDYCCHITA